MWDIYEKSVPMSTYLVAFMVSDLASREADPGVSDTLFRGQSVDEIPVQHGKLVE